jgi:hypothetical protein
MVVPVVSDFAGALRKQPASNDSNPTIFFGSHVSDVYTKSCVCIRKRCVGARSSYC